VDCCAVHQTNANITSLLQSSQWYAALSSVIAWLGERYPWLMGRHLNIDALSVVLIDYLFYPVALLLGVERNTDLFKVSKLIGMKVIANEFVV
jgi:CNT family concentrative nucleoside transporter